MLVFHAFEQVCILTVQCELVVVGRRQQVIGHIVDFLDLQLFRCVAVIGLPCIAFGVFHRFIVVAGSAFIARVICTGAE